MCAAVKDVPPVQPLPRLKPAHALKPGLPDPDIRPDGAGAAAALLRVRQTGVPRVRFYFLVFPLIAWRSSSSVSCMWA